MAKHKGNGPRYALLLLVLVAVGMLIGVAYAGAAKAAPPKTPNIPGIETCPKEAPFAHTPEDGMAGLLGERPLKVTTDNSPEHIWSTGGFAGLKAHAYDMGCSWDPSKWIRISNANAGAGVTNTFLSLGDSMVSMTDSLDRRAWSPGWLMSFMDNFAQQAVGTANKELILPYAGAALALVTLMMLLKAHDGNYSRVATGSGWIIVVLAVTALLLTAPLTVSKIGAATGSEFAATLNGGPNASDAITNRVVYNVQYQGWLRRNFGTSESEVAKKYGPALLASTRVSWAELDAVKAKPAAQQAKAREDLTKTKAEQFKDLASKVEKEDKTAYKYLTGEMISVHQSVIEAIFLFFASAMRLSVALLMIASVIALGVLGTLWVVLTPILMLPEHKRWSGQRMGMGMIGKAMLAVKFVLEGALVAWLFGIFLQACMAPGLGLGWGLVLMIIGTIVGFGALAPIKKTRGILALGYIKGNNFTSKIGQAVKGAAKAYLTGTIAAMAVNKRNDERAEEKEEEKLSENRPQPQIVEATIFNPGSGPEMWSESQYTAYADRTLPGGGPQPLPAAPLYQRGATPPKDETQSPYRPYERSDDNEGANA
jgi:hypothetical protein